MLNELRKKIVLAAYNAKEGHVPSALSVLDILYVLYNQVLGPDDKFVLSKGHASLGLYAVLGLDLSDFGKYESRLGGHPDRNKVPRVAVSSGSLGHGLPQAIGIALAMRMTSQNASNRVFCLVGDGECEEGSCWEAFNLADRYKLNNLTVIVDLNGSNDSYGGIKNLYDKLNAFGFVCLAIDGHEHDNIRGALKFHASRPVAILARTVKGKGVVMMENNPQWHHKIPDSIELEEILQKLQQ